MYECKGARHETFFSFKRPPHSTDRYLVHLVTEDRRLPRRQEAEGEHFVDCTGKTRSALVDHEEVQAWAAG